MATAISYRRLGVGESDSSPEFLEQKEKAKTYFDTSLKGHEWGPCLVDQSDARPLALVDRPMGRQLCLAIQSGDHVVCPRTDRAFRDNDDFLLSLKSITTQGIRLSLLNLDLLDIAEKHLDAVEVLRRLLFAQKRRVSERLKQAFATRKAAGMPMNGHAPYGFKVAGPRSQRRYVPDPQERAVMAQIVEMKNDGMSSERIAVALWKQEIKRRNGKDLGEEAVRQAYHAELALRKEGPKKRCYACQTYKPLDGENFNRNPAEKNGFHRICRPYRNKTRRADTRRAAEKKTSDAITKFERAVRKGADPMSSEVVEQLSPEKFAQVYVDAFRDTKAGSQQQVSMLEAAFQLADRGGEGQDRPDES